MRRGCVRMWRGVHTVSSSIKASKCRNSSVTLMSNRTKSKIRPKPNGKKPQHTHTFTHDTHSHARHTHTTHTQLTHNSHTNSHKLTQNSHTTHTKLTHNSHTQLTHTTHTHNSHTQLTQNSHTDTMHTNTYKVRNSFEGKVLMCEAQKACSKHF